MEQVGRGEGKRADASQRTRRRWERVGTGCARNRDQVVAGDGFLSGRLPHSNGGLGNEADSSSSRVLRKQESLLLRSSVA